MALFTATLAAATAHGLRMTASLVVVKMIAVSAGPSGMGILGHFMSLCAIISILAGGGIGNGIAKYVAEYKGNTRRMLRFIGSSIVYGFGFSFFIFTLSILSAQSVSRFLFGDIHYAWLIPCLGFAHFLCFVGTAVIAIVNGLQRSDIFAKISALGYLGAIPIAFILIFHFSTEGAALALLLVASCTGLPALWLVFRSRLTRLIPLTINRVDASKLMRFTLMLLASATLFPVAEIFIRTQISNHLGTEAAGLWQGMNRLSGAYLGFFTVYLATSYMPLLSSLQNTREIVTVVRRKLLEIGLAFICFACIIYVMRELIIKILFSEAFNAMAPLFAWQLLGDFFRLSAYVIGFLGVAKAAVKIYIVAELVQTGLLSLISYLVIFNEGNLEYICKAYAATYFVYFCIASLTLIIYSKRGEQNSGATTG